MLPISRLGQARQKGRILRDREHCSGYQVTLVYRGSLAFPHPPGAQDSHLALDCREYLMDHELLEVPQGRVGNMSVAVAGDKDGTQDCKTYCVCAVW